MLPKNCQESQDITSLRILPRKIQKDCQEIQTTKRSKLLRCKESKGFFKRSKGPRNPCYPSYQEIHVVQELPEKSTFSEAELFLVLAFTCIVKQNLVQACNQKKGPSCIVEHVMKVSVTCQFSALILHHYRNSP